MSSKPWYAWYVGDARAKMQRLSLAEKGAYRGLLDEIYATRKGLPTDFDELCRIAGATTAEERRAVQRVVKQFLVPNGDGTLHNRRADLELVRQAEFKAEQSRKGKIRAGGPRDERGRLAGLPADAQPDHQPSTTLPQPQPQSQPYPKPQPEPRRSSATAAASAAQPRPPTRVAIGFDLNLGRFTGIAEEDLLRWQDAYPAISVPDAVDQAAAWARANPANRKSNWERYLVNWFKRDQDRAGRAKP